MSTIRSFYDQLDPRYHKRVKVRGWNITPTVLQEPKLARQLFPEMTKEDHEREARLMADKGRAAKTEYQEALDRAIAEHGDLKPGEGAISGIYNRNFPEHVKDELRSKKDFHVFHDASLVHWRAAGKRGPAPTTWGDLAMPPGTRRG